LETAGIPVLTEPLDNDPSQTWVELETSHLSASRLPAGDALLAVGTEEEVAAIDAEFERLEAIQAQYDPAAAAPEGGAELQPYLIIGEKDHTEAFVRCLGETGYANPVAPPADPAEELRGKQGTAAASASWARCARDHGFPEVKDPEAPVADDYSTNPMALLPTVISEAELRTLLAACPPYDVAAHDAWDQAVAASGYLNPMTEEQWAELMSLNVYPYDPAIGFDFPGFRGVAADQDPNSVDAELTRRLNALYNVVLEVVDSIRPRF
jgi:hypothetical protein